MNLANEKGKVISSKNLPRFQFVVDKERDVLVFVVVIKILLVWFGSGRTKQTVSVSGSGHVFIVRTFKKFTIEKLFNLHTFLFAPLQRST